MNPRRFFLLFAVLISGVAFVPRHVAAQQADVIRGRVIGPAGRRLTARGGGEVGAGGREVLPAIQAGCYCKFVRLLRAISSASITGPPEAGHPGKIGF